MSEPSTYAPYAWLAVGTDHPDWWMQEACVFTFIHGITARHAGDVLDLAVQDLDLSADQDAAREFTGGGVALFDASDGWTVVYEDNGIPQNSSYRLATDPAVDEAVSVFANVNSIMEFAYWRGGVPAVRFESPDERAGATPDVLLTEMAATTGLTIADYERAMDAGTYLAQMMSLAQRVTSITLDKHFLQRRLLAVLAT